VSVALAWPEVIRTNLLPSAGVAGASRESAADAVAEASPAMRAA